MRHGIYEDESSFKNVITSNNINYYEGKDVAAHGRENLVSMNVKYKKVPHQDRSYPQHYTQTFDTRQTQDFIKLMKG